MRQLQRKFQILVDRQMGVERIALENHRDTALRGRHIIDDLLKERNLALIRPFEPRHDPQQRGLAAARGADDDNELAFGDFQIDIAKHTVFTV